MYRNKPRTKRLKKSLGQYFLTAPHIAEKTADAASILPDDIVLEIGPGSGALTSILLNRARKVIAVEKDAALVNELKAAFATEEAGGKLILINADILKLNLADAGVSDHGYKIVANIPYYITGAFIRMCLTAPLQPSAMALVVQKEVAERIACRRSGGRGKMKESVLSLSVKAYGTPRYVRTVARGAFRPQPNVDSAILAIGDISRDFFDDVPESLFFKVLKAGFSSKRKFLINNLEKIADKKKLVKVFQNLGIQENVRAEDLSLNAWKHVVKDI